MKYRFSGLILILFSTPVFSACYRSISQPLPDMLAPKYTSTLTSPSGDQEAVLFETSPTPNQNSVAELSPTPVLLSIEVNASTPTIQPTPTLAVTLAPIQAASSAYTLTHPTAVTLARIQLARSSQFLYSNTPVDALLYPAYHDILDFEWKHAYNPGIDFDQILPIIPNFYDHSQGRLTDLMLMDVIGDLVVARLNEQSYPLEDRGTYTLAGFSGGSYRIEIDGDPLTEWLIHIQNPDGYYLGEDSFWVTLDQGVDHQYLRLDNEVPWQYGFSSVESPKGVIADLTGDGLTDIAIAEQTPQSGGSLLTIYIAQGSPAGFSINTPSIKIETSDLPGASTSVYEWTSSSDKELPFLRVETRSQASGWPCEITIITEYRWTGVVFQAIESPPQFPETTSCAISQALVESSKSDYPGAIQWLEKTLQYPSGLSAEEQVFVLYRLALNQLIEDQYEAAQTYLDHIAELARSGSSEISQALYERIEPLLEEKTLTPYRLCLAAESLSTLDLNTPWDALGGIRSYPYSGYPQGYPAPLCEPYQFPIEFLNARFSEPQTSLPVDLEAEGFPLLSALDLYLSDTESYWLLVSEDNDPNLIFSPILASQQAPDRAISILGYGNGRWESVYSSPLGESPFYNFKDLTGDGFIDLGFAQPALNPDWNPCETDQIPYDLFVISALKNGWLIPFSDAFCLPGGEEPDFTSILADTDHDGTIDLIANTLQAELFDLRLLAETQGPASIPTNWYKHLYRTANVDYLLTELTNRLLSTAEPMAMRKEIDGYIKRWRPQSGLEDYLLAQLIYLSALQYEITGDFENARDRFYQIWEAYPDTLWAYLASTRLDFGE